MKKWRQRKLGHKGQSQNSKPCNVTPETILSDSIKHSLAFRETHPHYRSEYKAPRKQNGFTISSRLFYREKLGKLR